MCIPMSALVCLAGGGKDATYLSVYRSARMEENASDPVIVIVCLDGKVYSVKYLCVNKNACMEANAFFRMFVPVVRDIPESSAAKRYQ